MDKSTAATAADHDGVIKAHAERRATDDIQWRVFLSDLALLEAAQALRENPDMPETERWDILCAGFDASVAAFGGQPEGAVTP